MWPEGPGTRTGSQAGGVCSGACSKALLLTVLQIRIVDEGGSSSKMERMQLKLWIKRARLVPGNLDSGLLFWGEI